MEILQEKGWLIGGENSGHILCLDKHSTGDGIVSALQVLHALRVLNQSLAEANADLKMYPQILINVRVAKKIDFLNLPAVKAAVVVAEAALAGRGRVLLRPSGTEPLLRVMVEGEEDALVKRCAEEIAAVVRAAAE
jgi:phosphoglucosamine mutase